MIAPSPIFSIGTVQNRLAFNRSAALRYRIFLEQKRYAATSINLRLAAIRQVAFEAADSGLLRPQLVGRSTKQPGSGELA